MVSGLDNLVPRALFPGFGKSALGTRLGPGKPGPRATKTITPPYVENNYRIEVKIIFMLIAYLVLLCEFF